MYSRSVVVVCAVAVFATCASSAGCRFPPSVWCSSEDIAKECEVNKQLTVTSKQGTRLNTSISQTRDRVKHLTHMTKTLIGCLCTLLDTSGGSAQC